MQCRHTVPDWHRYVAPMADPAPVLAGCRLLVREGEPASDPRSIACAYWGHQRDCPLYEGPGGSAKAQPARAGRSPGSDVPVAVDAVWPARAPGAMDGMRLVIIGLGVLSTMLLVGTAGISLAALRGTALPSGSLHLTVAAATVSIVTHVLATLRTWARR